MRLVDQINSISLITINCDLERLQNKLDSEVEIFIGMKIDRLSSNNDNNNQYRAKVSFMLNVGEEISDSNRMITISHIIDFNSESANLDPDNKELNFQLFEIIEPYVRLRYSEVVSQSEFSGFNFPYRFWELNTNEPK